jgi:hypothetical protein
MMLNGKTHPAGNGKIKLPTLTAKPPKPPLENASEFAQLNYLQKLLLYRASRKECADLAMARLALAFCALGERKRVLRGIPDPGQLRPDLDPVQLAKALRAHRDRAIHDVAPEQLTYSEERPPEEQIVKPKESIPKQGGGDGVGVGRG